MMLFGMRLSHSCFSEKFGGPEEEDIHYRPREVVYRRAMCIDHVLDY